MLDAQSVITHATHGIVKDLASENEISLQRMYERLGDQCVYPKAKQLIRQIGRLNPQGALLIKADLDALFEAVLGEQPEPTVEELHKEAFEAIQSVLAGKPKAVKVKELTELVAIAQRMLAAQDGERGLKAV